MLADILDLIMKNEVKGYAIEELIDGVVQAGPVDKPPTKKQIRDCDDAPTPDVYMKEFGSIEAAVEEAGYDSQNIESTETDIESQLFGILDQLGVIYQKEKDIGNYRVDAFLPHHDIAIEADGNYWHGHPDEFDPDDERQVQSIKTDRKKNKLLSRQGIAVCRFWGDSLRHQRNHVLKHIKKCIDDKSKITHGRHPFGPEPVG